MKDETFQELLASVREGGKIRQGQQPPSRRFEMNQIDVKGIRAGYDLSQNEFAALLGISVRTLQNWEQGHRVPEGPARVLLMVAAKHPEAILDVVQAAK
jgi:putative transcriptional regulator